MLFIPINCARSKDETPTSVYLCDFDGASNTCGGELFSNNSGVAQSFSFQQNQIIVSTTVTDISSISKYFWINII